LTMAFTISRLCLDFCAMKCSLGKQCLLEQASCRAATKYP
jgi:hypothetical protein